MGSPPHWGTSLWRLAFFGAFSLSAHSQGSMAKEAPRRALAVAVVVAVCVALLDQAWAATVTSNLGKARVQRARRQALDPGCTEAGCGQESSESSAELSEPDPKAAANQNWGDIWDDPINYNKLASSDIHGQINVIRNQNTLVNTVLDKNEAYHENEQLLKKKSSEEDSNKKAELQEEEKAKAKEVLQEERAKKDIRDRSAEADEKRTRNNAEEEKSKQQDKKDGEATIVAQDFAVAKNYRRSFKFDARGAYSYTFWIKPLGKRDGWANIMHSANRRRPAVWFHPGRTRLHVRSESPQGWNTGCDPDGDLVVGQWLHVAFVHDDTGMRVYYDGKQVCQTKIGGPMNNQASFIWLGLGSNPANARLADLRYYGESIADVSIQGAAQSRKYIS